MNYKLHLFGFVVVAIILAIQSCKKEKASTPTILELLVKDELGNPVSDASIKFYTTDHDLREQKNQFCETQYSDANGNVTISGINNIKYYWFVEKGCKNNYNAGVTSADSLIEHETNKFEVIVKPTGTLKFVNNSSNMYDVYINEFRIGLIRGMSSEQLKYILTGEYKVKVRQASGINGSQLKRHTQVLRVVMAL